MMKLNLSPRNCFQNFRVSTTTKKLFSITFRSNCGAVWPQNGFCAHIWNISNFLQLHQYQSNCRGRGCNTWVDLISMGRLPPHQYQS